MRPLIACCLVLGATSCAPSSGTHATDGSGAGGGGGVSLGGGGGGSVPYGDGGGPSLNIGGSSAGGGSTIGIDGGCAAQVSKAEKTKGGRADIIWVLDNSGSMTQEAAAVQAQMNTFSSFIAGTGIDVHVVVVSSGPASAGSGCAPNDFICNLANGKGPNGVCVEPPLGLAGACPNGDDTNFAAGYMHWRVEVGSNDALLQLRDTFQGWQSMLRPDATKTFVVVTDDEADAPPTVDEFVTWVNQQPEFASAVWRYSGIYCIPGQTDNGNCAAPGTNHEALRARTGGVAANMGLGASTDWGAVFQQLADAVVADAKPVECQWVIPPPPAGEKLDPAKVNVRFTPSSGPVEPVYGVETLAACTDQFKAWYYDDPNTPTRLVACPATCPLLQADDGATVAVAFGCASEKPPIR